MLYFRNFPLAKKVMDRRFGGGGEYQDSSLEMFLSRSSKIFRRESSNVLLISGFEKS